MSYTTPITDRNAADIAARNSKAFMNVVDWSRIYDNSKLVHDIVEIETAQVIAFTTISTPTTSTIPTITDVNALTGNIELTRFIFFGDISNSTPGTLVEIKDDYEAGASKPIFDYRDVNLWESTLDAMWEYFDVEECPTLTGNLTVLTGTNQIYVDCLDDGGFDIEIESGANLYII